jgi:hypothetical protein
MSTGQVATASSGAVNDLDPRVCLSDRACETEQGVPDAPSSPSTVPAQSNSR